MRYQVNWETTRPAVRANGVFYVEAESIESAKPLAQKAMMAIGKERGIWTFDVNITDEYEVKDEGHN